MVVTPVLVIVILPDITLAWASLEVLPIQILPLLRLEKNSMLALVQTTPVGALIRISLFAPA